MAVLGSSSKPNSSYFGAGGTSQTNQVAEKLTAPAQKIRIVSLGAWIGGWSDTFPCELTVWALDNTVLGRSVAFTVANEGTAGTGKVSNYVRDLITPVELNPGTQFYVGTNKDRDGSAQWSLGPTGASHYQGRGNYPGGIFGSVEGPTSTSRRAGMYVANYEPVSAARVYRGSGFVEAQDVLIFRGDEWVPVDGIYVRRGTSWVEPS